MTDFRLTDETYERIMGLLDEEMTRGLGAQSHQISTVRMFPTYVRSVPDGSGNHYDIHCDYLHLTLQRMADSLWNF